MRQRKKLSWTKRGFVRTLGPKGFEKKFYLGFDPHLAEQKEKAIVVLWQQMEERGRERKVKPAWDDATQQFPVLQLRFSLQGIYR